MVKRASEAPIRTNDEERMWWLGRCPRCGVLKMAVEVGEGDSQSKGEMERLGYRVNAAPIMGRPDFRQPHSKECQG